MKILLTGSDGFVGKNLIIALKERTEYKIIKFNRESKLNELKSDIKNIDLIIHLAGENRPSDSSMFQKTNVNLTEKICKIIKDSKKIFL